MNFQIYMIYVILVLVLSCITVFTFGGVLHFLSKRKSSMLPVIIFILAMGLMLSNLFSGRNLTNIVGVSFDKVTTNGYFVALLVKFLDWVVLGISSAVIFEKLWVNIKYNKPIVNSSLWFWVFLIFSLTNGPLSSLFGSHPAFSSGLFFSFFVFALLVFDDKWEIDDVIKVARTSLLIILISSLALLPIFPGLVLEQNVVGILPNVHFRYWGLTPHANAIGPLSISFLLFRFHKPFSSKYINYISIIVALVTLIISQSKTSIIAGLIAYSVILNVHLIKLYKEGKPILNWSLADVAKLLLVLSVYLGSVILFIVEASSDGWSRLIDSDIGNSISTLSGRTRIWEVAISEWRKNPLFGYGPGLFSEEHRIRLGMSFAYHAHNQFLQSLAQSGFFGLGGLMIFLILLTWKSFKYSIATKGVTVAVLLISLIRSLTEVPFYTVNMFSGDFILLLAWTAILISCDLKNKNPS